MPGTTQTQYYTQRTTTTTTTHTKKAPRHEGGGGYGDADGSVGDRPVPAARTKAVTMRQANNMPDNVRPDDSSNVVLDTLAALVTDCNATADYLRSRSSSRQNLAEIPDEDTSFVYQADQLRTYTPPTAAIVTDSKQRTAVRSPTSPSEQPVLVEYKLRLHQSPYPPQFEEPSRRPGIEDGRTSSLERVYNEFGLDTPRDRSISRTRSETPSSRRMIVLEDPKDRDVPICAFCDQPIYGACVTALAPNARKAQKYHPPHFICTYCTKPLNLKGTYREHERKPYCHECFYRLFSGHVYEVDAERINNRV